MLKKKKVGEKDKEDNIKGAGIKKKKRNNEGIFNNVEILRQQSDTRHTFNHFPALSTFGVQKITLLSTLNSPFQIRYCGRYVYTIIGKCTVNIRFSIHLF